MSYGIEEHRHRFSVWAAARAAQRGFTSVAQLRTAIELCGVRDYLKTHDLNSIDADAFESLHRSWCRAIMTHLDAKGVKRVSFGRAAKLVGVYLKSMVILGERFESTFAKVAHPPIDGIILSRVAESSDRGWAKVPWTKLDEQSYYRLVADLRAILPADAPFWALEEYWTVTGEPNS